METKATATSYRILFINTLAFTICFAVWMLNGVLVTFLTDNKVFNWGPVEVGWLLGIPVLTGSLARLPAGILTDRYGGRIVFGSLMLLCSVPLFLLSYANSFWSFAILSFGFGLAGSGFAVGVGYTSVWFPRNKQGLVLGIFGAGNAGSALTTLFAPTLLLIFTRSGLELDNWRSLPKLYAAVLASMGIIFLLFTKNKKADTEPRTFKQLMKPLGKIRIWRFGLYYFLVFGCFVAFSQWLVPYFVNVYAASLTVAGFYASVFSFPSGVIRALGGWMSDKWGPRKVLHYVLVSSVVLSFMLVIPQMEITSPGKGVMALKDGVVTSVDDHLIRVDDKEYSFASSAKPTNENKAIGNGSVLPVKASWQEPVVQPGMHVKKKQLLAKGVTRIYFEANQWVYAVLVTFIGIAWGIGKAAVYKYIPEYFPGEVGVAGGIVGVLGGLGGFLCPILFGYLLDWTGLWTSCWMFMLLLSVIALVWMKSAVKAITHQMTMKGDEPGYKKGMAA